VIEVVWESTMNKNAKRQDGRGRSAGSRETQFSRDRQPNQRGTRKRKIDPEAERLLHEPLYEKVSVNLGGKRVKLPFIEALLRLMRKNALAANIGDQIKYLRELIWLGVFDFEDYKKRWFRRLNNHYREAMSSARKIAEFLDVIGPAFRKSHTLYMFYFTAFAHARQHCTCGSCDRGLDYAEFNMPIILKAALCPEEDESEDGGEDEIPKDHMQSGPPAGPSGPIDKDDDDAFYDGFGFD
jgi:hypothetical protein